MSDHDHHDHPHAPETGRPDTQDTGSQALAEALRSSFIIVKIAMVALVVIIFAAGFFRVSSSEKAIILRFGKPQGEGQKMLLGAGLHWSLPYPIDEVIRIPITEIQQVKSTVGWYLTSPEMELIGADQQVAGNSLNPLIDGYVITADRNIIHTRATVSYHIDDPRTAIFNFASGTNHSFSLAGVANAVQNAANNALIATAARFNVDDILTRDIAGFQDAVKVRVSELAEREHLGVVIDQCQVQSVAPRQLKNDFAQVAIARQNRETKITEAQSKGNQILSQAGAQAAAITNSAESARTLFVTSIQSEAEAFTKLLPSYQTNASLFAQMELTKAMSVVLTNVQRTEFLPQRADGKPREIRLMVNDAPPQSKSAANP